MATQNDVIHIRPARLDDAETVSRLILPLARKFIANEFSPEGARTLLDSFECAAIEGYLQEGYRYHLAQIRDQIIGVISVRNNSHLYHLFVDERYQRQGIARSLWDTAREAAIAAGNPGRFTVNSSRYAVAIYRHLGFVETGPATCSQGVVCIPMEYTIETAGAGQRDLNAR